MKYTVTVKNITEYIAAIEHINGKWGTMWYRGVKKVKYPLIPGLFRNKLEEYESSLVHEFLVAYKGFVMKTQYDPWELYGLMQIHGLPTRLLDWTRSPLVALYFALEGTVDINTNAAVWAIDPWQLNKWSIGDDSVYCISEMRNRVIQVKNRKSVNLDTYLPGNLDPNETTKYPKRPLAIEPPVSHPRLEAQQGCFTIHGARQESINAFFENEIKEPHIALIEIQGGTVRKKILQSLYMMGINEEFIYRDLDALSKRIIRERKKDS